MDLANKHLAAGLSCEKPYYPIKTMAYKQLLYALSMNALNATCAILEKN